MLEQAQPGDMLCMTAPGHTSCMGDLLATNLTQRGLAAAVVDGERHPRDAAQGIEHALRGHQWAPCTSRGCSVFRAR